MAGVESELVLRGFNDTFAPFPAELCVHDLVAAQAARTPDAVALEWRGDTMSYAELHASASRVAAWLAARGVAPDGVVALQLDRSLKQVVGVYGVLLSGGAYLPLDPKWPLERRRFMVEDAACGWLVAQSAHAAEFAGWFGGAVLALDDARRVPEPAVAAEAGADGLAAAAERVRPHHLAYVIYTSGSTGKPKGVLVEHGGVVNLLHGMTCRGYPPGPARFGISINYIFDPFVCCVFGTLAALAGTCVLLQDNVELLNLSTEGPIDLTHLSDVPSVVSLADIPRSVTWIESGGEALTQAVLENVPTRVKLFNVYGPTEVTIASIGKLIRRAEGRLTSIGRPLPNVTCYVVDPASTTSSATSAPLLQPISVWGELWLGGVQVARGYLNRPELTAERFVRNPWPETDPSGRGVAYRTGDRVRWCAPVGIGRKGRCTDQHHRACRCLGWADQALQGCVCGARGPIQHVTSSYLPIRPSPGTPTASSSSAGGSTSR